MEEAIPKRPFVDAQHICQRFHLVADIGNFRWDQADDEGRSAPRDHGAVPIENHSPRRRHRNEANLIGLRLRAVALTVNELDRNEARKERDEGNEEDRTKRGHAPRRQTPRRRTRSKRTIHRGAVSNRRTTRIAATMISALSAAWSRASRKRSLPRPDGYPESAMTIQKHNARTSVAIATIAVESGTE